MRRALQYVDDHLGSPITVADIAEAAGLSTRGLYAGFQRDLDETPMAYLRAARLNAAREQLRDADPTTVTVAEVAARWGFVDAARFARRYAALFHESPQETLRR
jgi:transcriptional regulator GlxA family with amidase domain